ncbi:MAG: UvrB/UvrC motif-containing protein [Phycisphaerae bacterium]
MMNSDIRPIIDNWPYRAGKISVRKITGDDGRPKIQMRLDLGLLQMEAVGRPDGQHPNDCDTLYDFYYQKMEEYKRQHHTDIGFELSGDDCRQLRDEALMYYHRYLACFILEDYEQVLYDTQRNIQIFDLCNKYAARKSDRMVLEQYRPYVIMMNTRAKAHLASKSRKFPLALRHIKSGLRAIKKLYDDVDQPEDFPYSPEADILKHLAQKLRKKLPGHPLRLLEKKLQRAVEAEQFEDAARIRNQIEKLKKNRTKKKATDNSDAGEDRPE